MHPLDHLIQLARVQGILDLRCLLNGPMAVAHEAEPEGVATYHVVLAGQCRLNGPGMADVALSSGDILLLPRGQAHVIHVEGDARRARAATTSSNNVVQVRSNVAHGAPQLDLLCGRFAYMHPAALIDALPDVIMINSSDPVVAMLVNTMRLEVEGAKPGAQAMVGAFSTALFAMVLRAWLAQAPELTGVLALLSHARLGKAVTAMLAAPGEHWSIALLAQRAAMSRASFMRAYAALSPHSPMESLARMRMQQASDLLVNTNQKIGDIAAAVGYASETAFAKKFSEILRQTPRQFRASRRN